MTKKICVIGNAGSGKTTLVSNLFRYLKENGKNAEMVSEFIRTDIQANGPMTSVWEQYRTRENQKSIEDAVPQVDYLIVDSGTLTPYFYACLYYDKTDVRQRLVLQDMYKYLVNDLMMKRYSHVLFLPRDQTYATNKNILSDGTRYQTDVEIEQLESHMSLYFNTVFKLDNVFTLNSPLAKRLDEAVSIIL